MADLEQALQDAKDLSAKVDNLTTLSETLQADLDTKQAAIAQAIADLKAQIAAGGLSNETVTEILSTLEAANTKADTVAANLQATDTDVTGTPTE